jgi:MFS family permease
LLANFVLFLVIFLFIESRVDQPMVDLTMFRKPTFSVGLLTGYMTFVALGGIFILPFYLQGVLGYQAAQVGLLLSVLPITLSITSPLSGILSDRFGPRGLATGGLLVIALTFLLISTLQADTSTLGYILRIAPLGIGFGLFQSPNNSAIMGSVIKRRLGIASGFLAMSRTLGQTTGVALFGAIFAVAAAAYAGQTGNVNVDNLPPNALVLGMHDAFRILAVMMFIGTGISAVGLWKKWENRLEEEEASTPQAVSQESV